MNTSKSMRGEITDIIKAKSVELLGYAINKEELGLMAHLQVISTNWHNADKAKINRLEWNYIDTWEENGYLSTRERTAPICKVFITKEFWDIICELVFMGYVDVDD
jgi:hypothetical protein